MKVRLHVAILLPNERAREFDLEFAGPEILIGRDKESDIQIPLNAVSRRHAKIVESDGQWFVEDLASTHGTTINGQSISTKGKKLLREGDVIGLVQASVTFHLLDETNLEETSDDKTAIVAQKMVSDILNRTDKKGDLPYLLVMNGPKEGTKILIPSEVQELTIGRTEKADLRVDDVNVSRKHAKLKREWNDLVIEDLGSRNGVIVNGRKISTPTRLNDADEIYLGAVHLTFIDPTASIIDRLEEMAAFAQQDTSSNQKEAATISEVEPSVGTAGPETQRVSTNPQNSLSGPPRAQVSLASGIGGAELILVALAVAVFAGLIYGIMLLFA